MRGICQKMLYKVAVNGFIFNPLKCEWILEIGFELVNISWSQALVEEN